MMTVNTAEALARLDDDREIYEELIEAFLQDSPADMNNLRTAVSALDMVKIAYHAHKIKGAALTLGAERLSNCAEILEKAARKEEAADYHALFRDMEAEYTTAAEELASFNRSR